MCRLRSALLHRLVSPYHACHAGSCFLGYRLCAGAHCHCCRRTSFSNVLHPFFDPCGRCISPSSCFWTSSSSESRSRGSLHAPCSPGNSSSRSSSASHHPNFSGSLSTSSGSAIALSPRYQPGPPYHSRSPSSAWTPYLALSLQCQVGARLVEVAKTSSRHGPVLPYQTSFGGRVAVLLLLHLF